MLWLLDWFASHRPQRLAGAAERLVAVVEHHRRTGRVVRQAHV